MGFYKNTVALVYFLGQVPNMTDAGTVRYSWFYKTFNKNTCVTENDYKHVTRAFLLYLFAAVLFPNKDSQVHLNNLARMKACLLSRTMTREMLHLQTCYTLWPFMAISRRTTLSIGIMASLRGKSLFHWLILPLITHLCILISLAVSNNVFQKEKQSYK